MFLQSPVLGIFSVGLAGAGLTQRLKSYGLRIRFPAQRFQKGCGRWPKLLDGVREGAYYLFIAPQWGQRPRCLSGCPHLPQRYGAVLWRMHMATAKTA